MFTVAEIEKEVAKAKAAAKTETVSKLGELRAELVRHIDGGLEAAAQQLEAVRQEVTQQAAQLEGAEDELGWAVSHLLGAARDEGEDPRGIERAVDIAVIVARAVGTRIVARGERWRSNTRAQNHTIRIRVRAAPPSPRVVAVG